MRMNIRHGMIIVGMVVLANNTLFGQINTENEQLEYIRRQAEQLGISEKELLEVYKKNGREDLIIKSKIEEQKQNRLKQNQKISTKKDDFDAERNKEPVSVDDILVEEDEEEESGSPKRFKLTKKEDKIFGYKLFKKRNLDFIPSDQTATPKNYILGGGDELIIEVYGAYQKTYRVEVSPDGNINVPVIGIVSVSGLSIDVMKKLLIEKLSKIHAGIKGSNPNTFIQVSLGNMRTIKVNVVGEVKNPGAYLLPSFSPVFHALYSAGGPSILGTLRHIQVYRLGKLITEVDVYTFLLHGDVSGNIRLEDNDVVLVRRIENRIEVKGQVRTPGYYEMKPQETVLDLLKYVGGFTDMAYKEEIKVVSTYRNEKEAKDVSKQNYGSFTFKDGDRVEISKILSAVSQKVQVAGAVFREGIYEYTKGMTLKQLVYKAGGVRKDAFMDRAIIYRTEKKLQYSTVSINLNTALDSLAEDFILQESDVLHLPSIYDIREEFYVQITGEVNKPGYFPYLENMTVADLIIASGGIKNSASKMYIEIARRTQDKREDPLTEIIRVNIPESFYFFEKDTINNIILSPFDYVFIRKNPSYEEQKTVNVMGEVVYPGEYALENNQIYLSDILKRCGLFTKYAYIEGASLKRRTEKYIKEEKIDADLKKYKQISDYLKNTIKESDASIQTNIKRLDIKIQEIFLQKQEKYIQEQDTTSQKTEKRKENEDQFTEEYENVDINLPNIIKKPKSKQDIILKEGDIILIPSQLETVKVRGEVLHPTSMRYDGTNRFRTYINRSGGFSFKAKKGSCYVIYPNGRIAKTKNFVFFRIYPKLKPGSEIYVPANTNKRPITAFEIIGATSSLVTTLVLIWNITKN